MTDLNLNTKAVNILEIRNSNNEVLVTLRPDGTLEYGPSYNPDDTAKIFWNAITNHNPYKNG